MKKSIDMTFSDGSIHRIIATQADVTNDNKIIISYYDYYNGIRASFFELMKVDGKYYRNPETKDWDNYVHDFKPFVRSVSDEIIGSLPDKIELYDSKNIIQSINPNVVDSNVEDLEAKPIVKPGKVNYIIAVLYANNNEVRDNSILPVFFTLPEITKEDPMKELYRSIEIDEDDTKELLRYIDARLENYMDISAVLPNRRFEVSSGNKYSITFVTCEEKELFYEITASNKLYVDMAVSPVYDYYSDPLSLAVRHILPLELNINGKTIRYEINSNVGHKKVV